MLLQSCILDLIKKQKAEGKLTLKSINSKLRKIDLIKQNIRSKFIKYSKKLEKKYISELKKTSDSSYLKKEISPLIEKIDIEENRYDEIYQKIGRPEDNLSHIHI